MSETDVTVVRIYCSEKVISIRRSSICCTNNTVSPA